MKHAEIEIDRQLETPTENEVQRTLRKALEALGPNGEHWLCGDDNPGSMTYCNGDYACAIGAVHSVLGFHIPARTEDWLRYRGDPLDAAAKILGHRSAIELNDQAKDFSEVRTLFLRAIELSA